MQEKSFNYAESWFIRRLMKLGSTSILELEESRRRIPSVFVLVTGIFVTFFFGVFHLFFGRYYIVSANMVSCAILVFSLLRLRKMERGLAFYRTMTFFFIIIFILIIIQGRTEISYFLWVFVYPAAVFSVLGKKEGLLLNALFLALSLLFMLAPEWMFGSPPYSVSIAARYILVYLALTFIIYNYETSQLMLYSYIDREKNRFEIASKSDPLTGLSNRIDILERILQEQARQSRSGRTFALVLCDMDYFKKLNDTHGHDCGDYVLRSSAELLKSQLRGIDCPSRWGGEEFLILLAESDLESGRIVAERIRDMFEKTVFHYRGIDLRVTMTFGICVCGPGAGSIDEFIKKADQALYEGKRQGRNRVIVANSE